MRRPEFDVGSCRPAFRPDGRTPIEMAVQRVMRDPASKPTLRETALLLGFVDEKTLDRVVDPGEMVRPNVASAT